MTESTEPMPEVLPDATAEDIADQHRSAVPDEPDAAVRSGAGRPEADRSVPGQGDEDDPAAGGLG